MRKLVSLVLALTMVLSLVNLAAADDVCTLDIYWIGNGDNTPVREGVQKAINEYIEPLIGANVEFHIIGWGDWTDKAINPLQSGEKMDLIWTADWEGYMSEVTGGLLMELDDLLAQYGEGITATLPEAFIEGTKVNGKLYGIATNKELCVPQGVIINKTAANAIGWDVVNDDPSIKTIEDLEPWFAKYKEMYPDSYPYVWEGVEGRWPSEPWCPNWIGMNTNCVAMKLAADENGAFDETIYNIFTTDEQKAHIETMYKWAQAGYISPDACLTSFDYIGKFGAGDFLAYGENLKGNNIQAAELYEANATTEFECCEITLQPKYITTTHAGGSMFSIPVTAQNPDVSMKYINLMHSDPTLINLMLFGKEGENYTLAADGRVELNDDANWYGVHGGAWTVGNTALQMVTTAEDPEKNVLLQKFADDAIQTASLGFRFVTDNVADQVAAVSEVIDQYAKPLMCGAVDPADPDLGIDALNAALTDAGIDDIIAEAQAQYDAWKEATK